MSQHIVHSDLKGDLNHQTFQYEQPTDPGAIGAGKWWLNTGLIEIPVGSNIFGHQLNYRNSTNDGWITL